MPRLKVVNRQREDDMARKNLSFNILKISTARLFSLYLKLTSSRSTRAVFECTPPVQKVETGLTQNFTAAPPLVFLGGSSPGRPRLCSQVDNLLA